MKTVFRKLTGGKVLEDYSGMEFSGIDAEGNEASVQLPSEQFHVLVENLSAGMVSANDHRDPGAIEAMEVDRARAHVQAQGAAVVVEVTFGSRGHLYLALRPELARELAAGIQAQLDALPLMASKTGKPN